MTPAIESLACGAVKMVQSHIHEYTAKHQHPPYLVFVHVNTALALMRELGLPPQTNPLTIEGRISNIPLRVCQNPACLGPDVLVGFDGSEEEI